MVAKGILFWFLLINAKAHSLRWLNYKKFSDPCHDKKEGDYNLEGVFADYFPGVNSQCYFVKCANGYAFTNPCSIGTKNDRHGGGFCSLLDHEYICGKPTVPKSKSVAKKRVKKVTH